MVKEMDTYKNTVASFFKGKKVNFQCDCVMRLDVTGTVVGFELAGNEIVYIVNSNNKIIRIGENTPHLRVKFV